MYLNLAGKAEEKKTFAVISRYMCGIVQHTQTPMVLIYEETDIR